MIRIHHTQHLHDVPLLAATFSGGLTLPPIIRLIPEPLIEAEKLALETFNIHETTRTMVGYTPKRAVGFPAWPILTDPGNAQHALNLVADVEWARRKAQSETAKVKWRIEQLTEVLQASAPHFLPTFLEELARIFADVGNLNLAKQYFTKARDMERTHSLAVDSERHTQAFAEFAALGIVSAKAFSQEARDAATRMQPQEAYDYFFNLLIDQAQTGAAFYTNAIKDLTLLGKKAGKSTTEVEQEVVAAYVPTRGYPNSPEAVINHVFKAMPTVLETKPDLRETFYTTMPAKPDLDTYVAALQRHGLWEPLCLDAELFATWLKALVVHSESAWMYFERSNRDLLDEIVAHKDVLTGFTIEGACSDYHLDYVDAFAAAGVTWRRKPHCYDWQTQFRFSRWCQEHHRDLKFLVEREDLRELLTHSLQQKDLENYLDVLLSFEATKKIVGWKLETYRKLREQATGSMFEWRSLFSLTRWLNNPRFQKFYPTFLEELLHVDPAEELAERLRRGTLAEYTWPTFEETALAYPAATTRVTATYPWVCVRSGKDLAVLSGNVVREYSLPSSLEVEVIPTDDDVAVFYCDPISREYKWMWLNEAICYTTKALPFTSQRADYVSTFDGTVYVGPFPIHQGGVKFVPSGSQVGFGPVYAHFQLDHVVRVIPGGGEIKRKVFHQQFAKGLLPGLEIPAAVAVAAENDAQLSFDESFTAMVTADTESSPYGVEDGWLYGISLTKGIEGSWYVSPLGTFQSANDDPFLAVKRPGGGVWYLRRTRNSATMLFDAATDTQISPSLTHTGQRHLLHSLPPAAFHQLKVRNEKASARMRNCTTKQAAQLLKNPARIVEFVENDSVLAAAVAGIIVDICQIPTAKIKLPVLDEVPQELEYLYAMVVGRTG